MAKKSKRTFDTISAQSGSSARADKLTVLLSAERGKRVRKADAIRVALDEAIERRTTRA